MSEESTEKLPEVMDEVEFLRLKCSQLTIENGELKKQLLDTMIASERRNNKELSDAASAKYKLNPANGDTVTDDRVIIRK